MPRLIGYTRVSTSDQDPDLQRHALEQAGASIIFNDVISGARAKRPGLDQALAELQPGDSLAVWKLDRLGRSVRQLVDTIHVIDEKGAHLVCLTQGIDTRTPGGRMLFHVIGAMAEFERDLIHDRVKAGMQAAKRAGKHVGRPGKMTAAKADMAREMMANGRSWNEVCHALGFSQATLSRGLKRFPAKEQ